MSHPARENTPDEPDLSKRESDLWTGKLGFQPSTNVNWVTPANPENPQNVEKSTRAKNHEASKVTENFVMSTMPQIFTHSRGFSVLWALAYLIFITILVYQAIETAVDFFSHPVNVQVSLESNSISLPFPAITVCNNNVIKKSQIRRMTRYQELANLDDVIYQMVLPEEKRDENVLKRIGMFLCPEESEDSESVTS